MRSWCDWSAAADLLKHGFGDGFHHEGKANGYARRACRLQVDMSLSIPSGFPCSHSQAE